MEDIVVVQSQDYAQIIFEDLNECYQEHTDLECLFSLNELVKIDSSDWIGIYKVGFTNCKDYVCKREVILDQVSESRGRLVFMADQIPKDDGEFYQFVYVSQQKQIRGASIPFQFKKTYLSDFIEVEDHEAIVYKSKESALNETLTEMKQRYEHLEATNQNFVKVIKENDEIINCLKDEMSSVKLRCLKLTMDNERLTHTLKTKSESFKNLQDQLTNVLKENSDLQAKFESLSTGQVTNLENQIKFQMDELTKLKDQLKRNEQIVLEQQKTIHSILGERDNLSNTVTKILNEKSDLDSTYQNALNELQMCKDKLAASEQCKEMLRSQLTVLTSELNETNEKKFQLEDQITEYIAKQKNSDFHISELSEKLESLKLGYENKFNETNGSYFALKLAHNHLENKLKQYEKDSERTRLENEELKDRIKAGAKEYSKLFEKYRLIKNKQFNHDLNVYTDLCGNEHLMKRNESVSTDSAIQEKTSQTRASSTDIENTLLDALLNSSLNNQPQKSTSTAVGVVNMRENFGKETLSDDGLNQRDNDEIFEAPRMIQTCDMCNYQFPTGSNLQDIEKHYNEQHYGPSCPICFLNFRKGYPQSDFENHVNQHFA